jgi:Protein of unknown function (DUF2950)
MSGTIFRRGLLVLAFVVGLAAGVNAQVGPRGFATPDDASYALADAIRHADDGALASLLGPNWRELLPSRADDVARQRDAFLASWDAQHSSVITPDGNKAILQAGVNGWTIPLPLVKEGGMWHFDFDAAKKEILARRIGHNELSVVQALLAICDAQRDYAEREALKGGSPQYARRLMSSPGKKDGLYWEPRGSEAPSPLGPLLAKAQPGDGPENGYYGYHFRLLYSQGPDARGGAFDYLVNGRMIGGFAVIAWPAKYGETGVMTFMVNYNSDVYEEDLGPDTPQRTAAISIFNPDKGWDKADMTPP